MAQRKDQYETPPKLDDIDRQIAMCLTQDARLSTRAIAREVGMSPGAISERIDQMEKYGVIAGYHARVDRQSLGYPITALIGVQMEQGNSSFESSLDELMEIEQVQAIKVVTGEWDLLVEVAVRDHEELKDVLLDRMWAVSGFRHSQTLVVLGSTDRRGFWIPEWSTPTGY